MQYYTILSLLVATGALAAPVDTTGTTPGIVDTVTVTLQGDDATAGLLLLADKRNSQVPANNGPFSTINVDLSAGAGNPDLRCQAINQDGLAIVGKRNDNIDFTFSDADKGEWTFIKPDFVKEVICDPDFKKIDPSELKLTVTLFTEADEAKTQAPATAGQYYESFAQETTVFHQVELAVGLLIKQQDFRCQALDLSGNPLVVLRNGNRDITFSDADKGRWTFETPSAVSKIICDPSFKAMQL